MMSKYWYTCVTAALSFGTASGVLGQDSLFVLRGGADLILGGRPFYATGVNSYFLQNLAAYDDTAHLIEIFRSAKEIGLAAIRTWGFYDSEDSTDPAVIQLAPGRYNEHGLRALDYVVAKAREYSLRLIVPLVNNWDDYGGMNQYVHWLAQSNRVEGKILGKDDAAVQKIYGAGARSYSVQIAGSLVHDDFYRDSTVKQWYKNYIAMLFNRMNTYTGRAYKDEPAILMWELANEPRSSDRSGALVSAWVAEMSTYVKSIDSNHLVGTGEEGHDVSSAGYSDLSSYGGQSWLFDGTSGCSFSSNTSHPSIDVASIHCYTEDWRIPPSAAITWMRDHNRIALQYSKPLIVAEVGIRGQMNIFFDGIFGAAYTENISGVLPWQFVYQGRIDYGGFAFSCPVSFSVCAALERYADLFQRKRAGDVTPPPFFHLYQNYPNPFNYITVISFEMPAPSRVQLHVYDLLGKPVKTLLDAFIQEGRHALLFDTYGIASGIYFARLTANDVSLERKLVLLK